MNDVTADLTAIEGAGHERERHRGAIPRLLLEPAEVDAGAIEPGWSAGLQPPPLQTQPLQRFAENPRRRLPGPPGRMSFRPNVDKSVQEGPGGHHHGPATDARTVLELDADCSTALDHHRTDPSDDPVDTRLAVQSSPHPDAVLPLVRLRPRGLHGRSAAPVQQLELNRGGIDRLTHQSAQGVDLTNQVPLRGTADRRVARHLAHGVSRERAEPHVAPQAGRRMGRLDAGMAGADDDDVMIRRHDGSPLTPSPRPCGRGPEEHEFGQ